MPLTVQTGELFVHVDKIIASRNDYYICSKPFSAKDPDIFVTKYSPKVNATIVHHIVLFAMT